jgi:hypothetical protein
VRPNQFLSLWYVWRKLCTYLALTLTLSPNGLKRDSTWRTSPRSSISCSNMIFEPMVRSAQTVHLSCVTISTISKWTEPTFHLSLVTKDYHWVCLKQFLSLMVHSAQIVHLSYVKTGTFSKQTEWASTRASSTRSTIGCVQNDLWAYVTFGANCAPILYRHQHHIQTDRSEIPQDPRHLEVPSGASKTISEPIERSAQTLHLSCVKISTISKWTKTRIHLSLVTNEYHQVCPKRFLSL